VVRFFYFCPVLKVTAINIYPVKGLPAISLNTSEVLAAGLEFDRRWMLVDEKGIFISQRNTALLSQFTIAQNKLGFIIGYPSLNQNLQIPFFSSGNPIPVKVWEDEIIASHFSDNADNWFSQILEINCRLVCMLGNVVRPIEANYNSGNDQVSFADGFPILMIGEESLNELNQKLESPILMDRFRPNIVFAGGIAFYEDEIAAFSVGSNQFVAVKPCARCQVTTINQQNGIMEIEPLKTLSTYRKINNKIMFGQNVIPKNTNGLISIGDELIVHSHKANLLK